MLVCRKIFTILSSQNHAGNICTVKFLLCRWEHLSCMGFPHRLIGSQGLCTILEAHGWYYPLVWEFIYVQFLSKGLSESY